VPKQAWNGYQRFCPLARGLDVIGERWTLVIIQELFSSPKRYNDLLSRLPGIGTSVLADRLRKLEAHGLVERTVEGVGQPVVYALTVSGRALDAPMRAFRQWGVQHLTRTAFPDTDPNEQEYDVTYVEGIEEMDYEEFELRVGDAVTTLQFEDGILVQYTGAAPSPTMVVITTEAFMRRWAAGTVDWDGGERNGDVKLKGDRRAWPRFLAATGYLRRFDPA
jgi:DNA-binding HxlR family transcriptional regulator